MTKRGWAAACLVTLATLATLASAACSYDFTYVPPPSGVDAGARDAAPDRATTPPIDSGTSFCTLATPCPDGQYCRFADGRCGAEAKGTCVSKTAACEPIAAGNCACDGRAFTDGCQAARAGVDLRAGDTTCLKPFRCGSETFTCKRGVEYCRLPTTTGEPSCAVLPAECRSCACIPKPKPECVCQDELDPPYAIVLKCGSF
jgi:hypothetical protein